MLLSRFHRRRPQELNAYFGLHLAPPAPFVPEQFHYANVAMVFVNYVGPMEQAEAAVRPLRQVVPPLMDMAGPAPYPAIQRAFDDLLAPGLQHYWKAHFVKELTDEAIQVHAQHAAAIPTYQSGMHLYPINGTAQRLASDATAWSYRDVKWSLLLWLSVSDRDAIASLRSAPETPVIPLLPPWERTGKLTCFTGS